MKMKNEGDLQECKMHDQFNTGKCCHQYSANLRLKI